MFILDTNDVSVAMYVRGQKVDSKIDLWHKWFNDINFLRLQDIQLKQLVSSLPKFSG